MTSVSIATTTPPNNYLRSWSRDPVPRCNRSTFINQVFMMKIWQVNSKPSSFIDHHISLSLKIIETQHSTRNKKHLIHFLSEFMFQSTLDWRIQKCGRRHTECSRFQVHHCWKHEVVSVVQHEHEDIRDFFLVFLHHLTFPLFFFPPSVWQRPFKCFNTF